MSKIVKKSATLMITLSGLKMKILRWESTYFHRLLKFKLNSSNFTVMCYGLLVHACVWF